MAVVPALAMDTYKRGLSVLVDALELANTAQSSDVGALWREIEALEAEVASLENNASLAGRLEMKQDALASYRERVQLLEALRVRQDELFFQAQRCEASLNRTRFELTAIRTGSREASVDAVVEALRRTIDQAKAVQDEVSRLGY
jgi:hypothetical protein